MRIAFVLIVLTCFLLAGCEWMMPSLRTTRAMPGIVVDSQDPTTIHILAICATLTPFADYREFMVPGQYVTETLVPPAEATLVFSNSGNCN